MPEIAIPRIGGMVTEPSRWQPGDCILSQNIQYVGGTAEGRRGSKQLWARVLGSRRVANIFPHRTRRGAHYTIVVGYAADLTPRTTVCVLVVSGRNIVALSYFPSSANSTATSGGAPIYGTSFGDDFLITGPAETQMLRVRCERGGVAIEEAVPLDRLIVPASAGDDPGPYQGRIRRGGPIATFQGRVFLVSEDNPDTLVWSNIGDSLGWSGGNNIPIREGGRITALAPLGSYLLVFKERMTHIVRGGFTTAEDTSVDVLDTSRGSVSHRGTVGIPGAVVTVSHDGVAMFRPGSQTVLLSADITNFIRGDLTQEWGLDMELAKVSPASLVNAPIAYLPTRNEIYVALSDGQSSPAYTGNLGVAEPTHDPQTMVRNRWLVCWLGDERPKWSVWFDLRPPSATAYAVNLLGEGLCGYVDADGNDTLLFGTWWGAVGVANCGMTDEHPATLVTTPDGLHDARSAGVSCHAHFAPIYLPHPGRFQVESIECAYDDTRWASTGSFYVNYSAGIPDGMDANVGRRAITLTGRSAVPLLGDALPFTMKSLPVYRTRPLGLRAVAVADALRLGLYSTQSMPAIRGPVVIRGRTISRYAR